MTRDATSHAGLAGFLAQADAVGIALLGILLLMSLASWALILS